MKKVNPLGIALAVLSLVYLYAIIFLGATHQFFFFALFAGLSYALLTEEPKETEKNSGGNRS